jgi:hypothetical protein
MATMKIRLTVPEGLRSACVNEYGYIEPKWRTKLKAKWRKEWQRKMREALRQRDGYPA